MSSTSTETRVVDARQPAELDRLLEAGGVGAQEGGAGAHEGVEDVGARRRCGARVMRQPATPRASSSIAAGGSTTQAIAGVSARAVSTGSRPASSAARDGGVVEAGGLADPGAGGAGGAAGDGAAEGDAHAATAVGGAGEPARARPSSSASARTCSRRPGSRKSSPARYSG